MPATAATPSSPQEPEIRLHSRQLVFENTVFLAYADRIGDSSGHEVSRYLSIVPKCLLEGSIAGVAVLPTRDERIGLIRVFRHPLGRWSWEAIKGHVDPGEDIATAAVRELREETGFSTAPAQLVDLGTIAPEAGVIEGRTRLFSVALEAKAQGRAAGELGHGEMVFFSRGAIHQLIAQGQIEDASTLVILYRRMWHQTGGKDCIE